MELTYSVLILTLFFLSANCESNDTKESIIDNRDIDNVFNGVYTECFMHLSYMCLQKKTLLYLKELNNLSEVSVIGEYVKFVKLNTSSVEREDDVTEDTEELAFQIDKAINRFFDNHVLKFNALGRHITMPRSAEVFVGRKKRKGGGGGGGGFHGGDDGGKKKMMMMAMMCMKMKLMMMMPAMMGMMGMMSFKGMMFSMMSFMLSKMMLLMKLLEKKGGGGGGFGGGVGGDGGWMTGGGGGGAWMPSGGQDFGGGGGGYDANGQWQSRSNKEKHANDNTPIISYVHPTIRYSNNEAAYYKTPVLAYKRSNVNFEFDKEPNNAIDQDFNSKTFDNNARTKRDVGRANSKFYNEIGTNYENDNVYDDKEVDDTDKKISMNNGIDEIKLVTDNSQQDDNMHKMDTLKTIRYKRSIIDVLQSSYMYWMNKILGLNQNRRTNFQRYKIINGVKYVYYPYPFRVQKQKTPKDIHLSNDVKTNNYLKPIITADDFNKGEIIEGRSDSRMIKKRFHKIKDSMNETLEDNPWE